MSKVGTLELLGCAPLSPVSHPPLSHPSRMSRPARTRQLGVYLLSEITRAIERVESVGSCSE